MFGLIFFLVFETTTQAQTLMIKAFERNTISGIAPKTIINIGGKETNEPANITSPSYYIYLTVSNHVQLSVEQIWIKQVCFSANILKLKPNAIILKNNTDSITIAATKHTSLWQIQVHGKSIKNIHQQKMQALISKNNLVVLLKDTKGRKYTSVIPQIIELEPERLQ